MTNLPPGEPIRTTDAAVLVSRPVGTIRRWGNEGWIRRLGRVGREATWDRSDVLATEAALAKGRTPPVRATRG